jgi:hypothetical protein
LSLKFILFNVNIVNYQVLTNLCPPFEYCSIFTSLATCSFLNSPINFKWLDVLCQLSFSVCCSSLQNGYWFLVLQFGSGSRLVEKNVLLSRSQLHNQLAWCSHLLVWLFQCDNQKSSTLFSGRVGDKLPVEQVWWHLVHLYRQFVTRRTESFSRWSLRSGIDNAVVLQMEMCR